MQYWNALKSFISNGCNTNTIEEDRYEDIEENISRVNIHSMRVVNYNNDRHLQNNNVEDGYSTPIQQKYCNTMVDNTFTAAKLANSDALNRQGGGSVRTLFTEQALQPAPRQSPMFLRRNQQLNQQPNFQFGGRYT